MICTANGHVWIWGSGSAYPGEIPEGLRCACGQYTRASLDDLIAERDALRDALARAEAEREESRAIVEFVAEEMIGAGSEMRFTYRDAARLLLASPTRSEPGP